MTANRTSDSESSLSDQVVGILRTRRPRAAFVTEIAAAIDRGRPTASPALDQALEALEADRSIVTLRESVPDPHLESFDLRVAALIEDRDSNVQAIDQAHAAAYSVWSAWVREFLAHHRCQ